MVEVTEISDHSKLHDAPLVTVSMLAYRHEKYIAQAIEGVVGQQCSFPFELIIGEDCSPDRTREIVLDYQKRYPHLIRVLISDQNVGMQANSARCAAAGRGKYGAPCEGDDYWSDRSKLARQIAVFEKYPDCVLVFHAAGTVDAQTGRKGVTYRRSVWSRFVRTEEIILGNGGFIPTASIMVRAVSGTSPPPAWVTDTPVPDYAVQMLCACLGRVAYINRVMSVWRTSVPHSWTTRHNTEFAYRFEHAQKVERMFEGFANSVGARYRKEAARMISLYYSHVLIRFSTSRDEARNAYQQVAGKLKGTDRVLAWLAARWGLHLPRLQVAIRKLNSLKRVVYSLLTTQRIDA